MKRATVRNAMVLQSRLSEGDAMPTPLSASRGIPFTSVFQSNQEE
jgi:hypothetical protein